MRELSAATTALVLIDLQNGIAGSMTLAPHSGSDVISRGKKTAEMFRKAGAPVVLVNVAWHDDFADALTQPVESPMQRPEGGLPPGWGDLVDGLKHDGDLTITKRQWSAFYGTELDLQLRRRGIQTIVIGGVATNLGVESTARQAHEHGYGVVFLEDAMSTPTAEMHDFAFRNIFPRIGLIETTETLSLKPA